MTTIYVTHDQIEAMTLGHRIAILNNGVIQQLGTPHEVYLTPTNKFVAGFIGSPAMNFLQGKIESEEGQEIFTSESLRYPIPERYLNLKEYTGKEIILGIRPEHITLSLNQEYSSDFPVQIGVLEPIGSDTFVYIDFPGKIVMTVKLEGLTKFTLNQSIFARFDDEQIHFFDIDSEERIQPIKE